MPAKPFVELLPASPRRLANQMASSCHLSPVCLVCVLVVAIVNGLISALLCWGDECPSFHRILHLRCLVCVRLNHNTNNNKMAMPFDLHDGIQSSSSFCCSCASVRSSRSHFRYPLLIPNDGFNLKKKKKKKWLPERVTHVLRYKLPSLSRKNWRKKGVALRSLMMMMVVVQLWEKRVTFHAPPISLQ